MPQISARGPMPNPAPACSTQPAWVSVRSSTCRLDFGIPLLTASSARVGRCSDAASISSSRTERSADFTICGPAAASSVGAVVGAVSIAPGWQAVRRPSTYVDASSRCLTVP